jgi:hypothetical protein
LREIDALSQEQLLAKERKGSDPVPIKEVARLVQDPLIAIGGAAGGHAPTAGGSPRAGRTSGGGGGGGGGSGGRFVAGWGRVKDGVKAQGVLSALREDAVNLAVRQMDLGQYLERVPLVEQKGSATVTAAAAVDDVATTAMSMSEAQREQQRRRRRAIDRPDVGGTSIEGRKPGDADSSRMHIRKHRDRRRGERERA